MRKITKNHEVLCQRLGADFNSANTSLGAGVLSGMQMAHVWGRGGATSAPTGAPTTVPTPTPGSGTTPEPIVAKQDATRVAKPQPPRPTPKPTPPPIGTVGWDAVEEARKRGSDPLTPLGEWIVRKMQ
jgi:hypothetical protein